MKTIMIVDDQTEIRELVEVTLNVGEYRILKATSGEEAIALACEHHPDLTIMDVMMPGGMDGLQTTRLLRENPTTRGSKIIMLTAKGQKTDIEKGLLAGADDYFVKPFSPLDLIRKVEEALKP